MFRILGCGVFIPPYKQKKVSIDRLSDLEDDLPDQVAPGVSLQRHQAWLETVNTDRHWACRYVHQGVKPPCGPIGDEMRYLLGLPEVERKHILHGHGFGRLA